VIGLFDDKINLKGNPNYDYSINSILSVDE